MIQVYRALMNPDSLPEQPERMDSRYADDQEAQIGTFLQDNIALECWRRQPETRPALEYLERALMGLSASR